MEEHCLELALDEMQLEESEHEPLDPGHMYLCFILVGVGPPGWRGGQGRVDVRPQRDDQRMEQDGAEIFDNEDKAPAELEA